MEVERILIEDVDLVYVVEVGTSMSVVVEAIMVVKVEGELIV